MANKISFIFPGQGSQFIGMGYDLFKESRSIQTIFEEVDDITQRPISKLCFKGPLEELTLTENLQPAITAVNLACLTALQHLGYRSEITSGHSLGEYSALVSSGVVNIMDALRMVQKRGELMQREAMINPGSMIAVIGLNIASVRNLVDDARGDNILNIANHNTAEQIVITGEKEPLARAVKLVKEKKGKAIPIKVSGAWHSKLMEAAVEDFRRFMQDIPFSKPSSKILFNASAEYKTDSEDIKEIMASQLVNPVMWYDIIIKMLEEGVDTFVEVGPKKVLTGLLKKIVGPKKAIRIFNVQDIASVKDFQKEMQAHSA